MLAIDGEVIDLLTQAVSVKFSFVAGVFLLIYDTVINFTDEVNVIWLKRWSLGKVLYLLTRYSTFFDAFFVIWYNFGSTLTPESCRSVYEVAMWLGALGTTISEVVLILRTYAIWDRSIFVLIYLSIFKAVAFVVVAIELDHSLKFTTFTQSPLPSLVPCIPILGNNRMFVVYCLIMGVDLNLLCFMLYRGLSQWQRNSIPLIHILYRDGVLFFLALFSINLANAIVFVKLFDSPYYYILFEPQRVLYGILSARVIFNLRKATDVTEVQTADRKSSRDVPAESMVFAPRSFSQFSGGQSIEDA